MWTEVFFCGWTSAFWPLCIFSCHEGGQTLFGFLLTRPIEFQEALLIFCIKTFVFSVLVIYSQACLMWPSKGTVKYGHIRQVVTKCRFNWYEMHCEGK
jgi:hypothetical protein